MCNFSLVKFLKKGDLDIVPYTWLNEDKLFCYYPTGLKSSEERIRRVKTFAQPMPRSKYKKYDVTEIHSHGIKLDTKSLQLYLLI